MPTKPSPTRVAHRFLIADEADPSYEAMLDTLRELANDGVATEYGDQKFLLRRLKSGDKVEILWRRSHTDPIKKQIYLVKSDFDGKRVYLEANRQSRSGGGEIIDHGAKYGVQWSPSMGSSMRRLLGLRKF